MIIPSKYQPRLIDNEVKEGYLNWSLNFFTDSNAIQSPYVDVTIQLDVIPMLINFIKQTLLKERPFLVF
jgi:chloramphenicol O-acetyltransferase